MTYLIDAWLDRPHPYLRILNRETGTVCVTLEEQALEELRELGDLDPPPPHPPQTPPPQKILT